MILKDDYFPLGTIDPNIYKVDAFKFTEIATPSNRWVSDVAEQNGFAASHVMLDDDWCGTGKHPFPLGGGVLGGDDDPIVNGEPSPVFWDMLG